MKSYPASCDFMVEKPPSYLESMNDLYNYRNEYPKKIINNCTNDLVKHQVNNHIKSTKNNKIKHQIKSCNIQ